MVVQAGRRHHTLRYIQAPCWTSCARRHPLENETPGSPTGALDIPSGLRRSSGSMGHPSNLDIPPLPGSSRHAGTSQRAGSPTLPGHPSSCLVIPSGGIHPPGLGCPRPGHPIATRDIPPAGDIPRIWVDQAEQVALTTLMTSQADVSLQRRSLHYLYVNNRRFSMGPQSP